MLQEEQRKNIQYLREVEKLSFRQIAEKMGIGRKKCSRLYSNNFKSVVRRDSKLSEYQDLIRQWFEQHPKLKATQVFERLQDRAVATSYTSVVRATLALRKKRTRCYFPLTFLPGEEGQVDWFFVTHPHLGKLSGFALILSHSRFLFAHLFPRHSFEFFIQGHLMAFQVFGGYPQALRYDNLSSVVIKREPLTYNSTFLDFARHYEFEIRLCNVAAGNEKGRVERVIRALRDTFFNTADVHQTLPALNQALHAWVEKRNHSPHRATEKPPAMLKEIEGLKSLPINPWLNCCVHPPTKPSKTGLLTFDTNSYSVPEYLVGAPLSLHSFCDRLDIYDAKGTKVASHSRSFSRRHTVLNPQHRTFTKITEQTKMQRILRVMGNIDPVVERFLTSSENAGENPTVNARALFHLLQRHSKNLLLSVIRETLARKTPRLKCVMSLLEPHPEGSPETVAPQNQQLLQVDYRPRSLSEYDLGA